MVQRIAVRGMLAGFLALVLGWPAITKAQESVTVKGEIVDMACYLPKGSRGPEHNSCAQMCAKRGAPIAVLTDAGDLYLLVFDHNDPEPYEAAKKLAGDRAEIKGNKFARQGIAGIVVKAAKGL